MFKENATVDNPLRQGRGSRKVTRLRLLPLTWIKQMEAPNEWGVLPYNFLVTYGYALPINVEVDRLPATFSEQYGEDDNGSVYRWQITFSIYKDTPEMVRWVERFGRVGFVVLLEDGSGACRVIGNKDFPMRDFKTASTIGGGSNTRSFSLGADSPFPALFAESINDADLIF